MKKIVILFIISLLMVITLPQPSKIWGQTSPSEIRGVWITKNDSDIWLDTPKLESSIQELAQLNFNTIYPVVWNSGYVSYDSAVAKRVGIPIIKAGNNQDIIAEITYQGHLNRLLVVPWFEFGFMTPPSSELATKHPRWLTNRRDGSKMGDSAAGQVVWLNPFHPQVQQFITDLILEICTRYRVDGIQFDDHMALPRDFGYDPYTVNLYKQETKKNPPANPQDREWVKWRADKITDFMVRLNTLLKQRNRNFIFSVAPNPYSTAYNLFLQDWKRWVDLGIVDELIIQVYRPDLKSFVRELNLPEVQNARKKIPTGVAILTGLRNNPTPITLIEDKVRQARRHRLGISFFYYETLWIEKATETSDLRKAVVRALFFNPQPRFPISKI
ncbi:glycoside hydrolase family 10 protein [Cyanobacterium sp. Dongsha4]|uniref:glycoside hydrolase family 10 protein n=1 Tax=Cyanobacterium sp. DS4 TaxID=2878255 RepID=UPI002E8149D0|nr:family 10 glycosylhydrolase [Cyanobacterium sp. Dongsha4]WVL00768.1 family 10 glycosylhydrolase [Cyanobacterium sp. Dongsha4]